MTTFSLGRRTLAVALALLVVTAANLSAAAPRSKPRANPAKGAKGAQAAQAAQHSQNASIVQALHQTNLLLAQADRDYKGHRANAVKEIRKAMRQLHPHHKHPKTAAKGTAKPATAGAQRQGQKQNKGNNEPQAVSDAQLKTAIGQLTAIQGQLTALPATTGRSNAIGHIVEAIKQLNIALSII